MPRPITTHSPSICPGENAPVRMSTYGTSSIDTMQTVLNTIQPLAFCEIPWSSK